MFSDLMFEESFRVLRGEVCFEEFPDEWRSTSVNSALGVLGTERGAWFEREVDRQLEILGIRGVYSREAVGKGSMAISLPGEFDFIGYSGADNAVVFFEDKMLQSGTEPKLWKNEIAAFLQDKVKTNGKVSRKAYLTSLMHIRIVFGRLGASIWPANRIVFGHPAAFNFGRPGALIWPANRTFLAA